MSKYSTVPNKKPLSTQVALHSPFIAIVLTRDDYNKVKSLLPIPSYTDVLFSYQDQKIILVYVIEGHITSHNQFRWISNIKLGIKDFIFVPLDFIDEFCITDTTDITNNIYTVNELSKAFKAPLIIYPRIMYPSTKQDLYRHLCWYGARLIHQKVFTLEALISAGLLMNKKLSDKHSSNDLHKKVLGAYMWLVENMDGFKVGLDQVQLEQSHSKGGKLRKDQRVKQTKERVQKLLKSGDFIKPNGKVNLTSLAKAMNMTRKTVAKYV